MNLNFFDPEERLLLLASRPTLAETEVDRLREIAGGKIDWEHFLEMAVFHRVFALVYRNLARHTPAAMSTEVDGWFVDEVAANQRRMLELTGELVGIARAFEEQGIPLLSLKGPALGMSVYGNMGLRPAGDLDLLVQLDDIPAALKVLRVAGYSVVLREPGAFTSRNQEAAVVRYLYHFILFDEARELVVELHFDLSPRKLPFPMSPTELFDRAEHIVIGGRKIPILHSVDNLLYLCTHGSKHAWSRLEWLVGVAELLKQMPLIDESALWQLAQKRNAGRPLLLGLLLAEELLETNVTPSLIEKARADRIVTKLVRSVAARLSFAEEEPHRQTQFQLALYRTPLGWLRWGFYTSMQPGYADIRFADLEWLPLYYLVRPIRLAGKLVPNLGSLKRLKSLNAEKR